MTTPIKALFSFGTLVSTPGALAAMEAEGPGTERELLKRHLSGDWGELPACDKELNEEAVSSGEDRIHSSYLLPRTKVKLWLITEADRSATTFLLPSEY